MTSRTQPQSYSPVLPHGVVNFLGATRAMVSSASRLSLGNEIPVAPFWPVPEYPREHHFIYRVSHVSVSLRCVTIGDNDPRRHLDLLSSMTRDVLVLGMTKTHE